MPSLEIGSVRSGWPGLRTYEAKSDFAASVYNSRLRRVSTLLSSDSESTETLGSTGYSVDLSDFLMPSYVSVSDLQGKV